MTIDDGPSANAGPGVGQRRRSPVIFGAGLGLVLVGLVILLPDGGATGVVLIVVGVAMGVASAIPWWADGPRRPGD
ncbi:hypothetical protein [Patulibacter minatonensis]|uniref:hypothetical protein n=1 Tax=Patulibacter minatonensis TaxID=298163 RepID=UPI00047BC855|nr:hypothetical protein [Patulibacter minatonensis]